MVLVRDHYPKGKFPLTVEAILGKKLTRKEMQYEVVPTLYNRWWGTRISFHEPHELKVERWRKFWPDESIR